MTPQEFYLKYPWLLPLVLIWTAIWKGLALWQAAQKRQPSWFMLILIINSLGLLEITYLTYLNRFDFGSQKLLAVINKHIKK
jgi:methionyl-tRNA synthetase